MVWEDAVFLFVSQKASLTLSPSLQISEEQSGPEEI